MAILITERNLPWQETISKIFSHLLCWKDIVNLNIILQVSRLSVTESFHYSSNYFQFTILLFRKFILPHAPRALSPPLVIVPCAVNSLTASSAVCLQLVIAFHIHSERNEIGKNIFSRRIYWCFRSFPVFGEYSFLTEVYGGLSGNSVLIPGLCSAGSLLLF